MLFRRAARRAQGARSGRQPDNPLTDIQITFPDRVSGAEPGDEATPWRQSHDRPCTADRAATGGMVASPQDRPGVVIADAGRPCLPPASVHAIWREHRDTTRRSAFSESRGVGTEPPHNRPPRTGDTRDDPHSPADDGPWSSPAPKHAYPPMDGSRGGFAAVAATHNGTIGAPITPTNPIAGEAQNRRSVIVRANNNVLLVTLRDHKDR